MRRWDEARREYRGGWDELPTKGEVSLLGALVLLAMAVYLGGWLWILDNGGFPEPVQVLEAPWAGCQELPGGHTWAPEGKRIVHLECPVE